MEQKKILSGILSAAVILCSASCGAVEITTTGYTSYDVREMERQIDGFWDYYERYEKAQQDLLSTIKIWQSSADGNI